VLEESIRWIHGIIIVLDNKEEKSIIYTFVEKFESEKLRMWGRVGEGMDET
jgi:hypothetical protein